MSCIDEGMRRAEESFRKAEAAHERDSGYRTGDDEIRCQVCGSYFLLRWVEEYGQSEYVEDPICTNCGWPVTTERRQVGYYEEGPYNESCFQAPCPVCGKVVTPKGETSTMIHLECGHWVRTEKWMRYADAYDSFGEDDIGLPDNADLSAYLRKHPEAGKSEKRLL